MVRCTSKCFYCLFDVQKDILKMIIGNLTFIVLLQKRYYGMPLKTMNVLSGMLLLQTVAFNESLIQSKSSSLKENE